MTLWTALAVKEAIARNEEALKGNNTPETEAALNRSLAELKAIR
ncbi:hypothetical protein ABEV74_14605 [Paenibacillus cisolokensis]